MLTVRRLSCVEGTGNSIPWASTCRYLGVFFISRNSFKFNYENVKKSLFKSVNAIFGKLDDMLLPTLSSVCCKPNVFQLSVVVWLSNVTK